MRTPALSPWNEACQSSSSSSLYYARHDDHGQDPDEMRKEIAAMRAEAWQRLQDLQEQVAEFEVERQVAEAEAAVSDAVATITKPATTVVAEENDDSSSFPQTGKEVFLDLMERELAALEEVNHNVDSSSELSASATDTEAEAVVRVVAEEKEEEAVSTQQQQQSSTTSQAEHLRRLDDTRWRVMLNIGREPGTWMPKEWGASGDRLHLHLELEFSSDSLLATTEEGEEVKDENKNNKMKDPGDDFLNGRSNTKVLKVVQNEGSMSPTMTEGSRKVRVKNGGWRVAPFEGPMATTVLRFYVELEEQASHQESDVWCPAGRVYCTCGYFPMYHDPITGLVSTCSIPTSGSTSNISPVSLKEALKEEQEQIAKQYEFLARANHEDPAIMSWDKLKRSSKMMKLKQEATKLAHKRYEWSVKEPDKTMLRLSQDQEVGLTKEGGVCCKVHKGLSMEYHMLGKFEIASMQNRDHKDYRELLLP
ncbi:MAG: hypothetical protein SGBAC_010656 [Bacillariaceae sp.]